MPEPPATFAQLEEYADATGGELNVLALQVLAIDGDTKSAAAARHIGVAYALAGLLRATAYHARFGRSFIPAELDPRRHALGPKATPPLSNAAETIAEAARTRLDKARLLNDEIPTAALPALLPGVVAAHWLTQIENAEYDLFAARVMRPDPWRGVRLFLAARRGRI